MHEQLPDEKNSLSLLDHSGNPREFGALLFMSLDREIKAVKATPTIILLVFAYCHYDSNFKYTVAGTCRY